VRAGDLPLVDALLLAALVVWAAAAALLVAAPEAPSPSSPSPSSALPPLSPPDELLALVIRRVRDAARALSVGLGAASFFGHALLRLLYRHAVAVIFNAQVPR